MVLRLVLRLYSYIKARGWRGRSLLLRVAGRLFPHLSDSTLDFPRLGPVNVNLTDTSSLALIDYFQGDLAESTFLIQYMELMCKPGDTLLDVGANIGVVSLHFTDPSFSLAHIVAIEPNPDTFSILEKALANRLIARAHPVALGKDDETLILKIPPKGSTTASIVQNIPGSQNVSIRVRNGDAFLSELGLKPKIIKIDVEGFESSVLEGLTRTIAAYQPVIFFEHIFVQDTALQAMIPPDYSLVLISDDGSLTQDRSQRSLGHDAILVPPGRMHLIEPRLFRP